MVEDFSVREMLIRIEGTVNLIAADGSRNAEDIRTLRERTHEHANEITKLHAINVRREGEATGFDKAIKAMYALAGVCGLGGIAAAVKIIFPHVGV